nr:hypothetical protein [uncultured Agathobaculum sp.]
MRCFSPTELADIQADYRNAASQKKQIGILADLYACTRQDIERALDLPETPLCTVRRKRPRKTLHWTPRMEAQLIALYDEMQPIAAIAEEMGLPPLKVKNKLSKLRERGRIKSKRMLASSPCAKGGGV